MEGVIYMARKAIKKTAIKICIERLRYLTGMVMASGSWIIKSEKDNIMRALGYRLTEEGEWYIEEGKTIKTPRSMYVNQYRKLAKLINDFYKIIDSFESEKTKYIAELRYIEGHSWKDIAMEMEESEQMIYSYRSIIVNKFREGKCSWAIGEDWYID